MNSMADDSLLARLENKKSDYVYEYTAKIEEDGKVREEHKQIALLGMLDNVPQLAPNLLDGKYNKNLGNAQNFYPETFNERYPLLEELQHPSGRAVIEITNRRIDDPMQARGQEEGSAHSDRYMAKSPFSFHKEFIETYSEEDLEKILALRKEKGEHDERSNNHIRFVSIPSICTMIKRGYYLYPDLAGHAELKDEDPNKVRDFLQMAYKDVS